MHRNCYFFISIYLMLVMNIKLSLCVLTFAEFWLSLYSHSDSKWSNIFYQYDGNCVLKNYLIFVLLQEKKSAAVAKQKT